MLEKLLDERANVENTVNGFLFAGSLMAVMMID